jgi:hypothetical protein
MTTTPTTDPLIERYLRQLKLAARRLPHRDRRELVADIEAHIVAGMQAGDGTQASLRNLLDALGTPEEIVASAQPHNTANRLASRERWALVLVLIGGLVVPVVGWIVGLVLLWSSPAWSTSKKWLATLVWPTGVALPLIAAGFLLAALPNPSVGLVVLVGALLAPVLVSYNLARSARSVAAS